MSAPVCSAAADGPGAAPSKCDRRWSVCQTRGTGKIICPHPAAEELELMVQRLSQYHGELSCTVQPLHVCGGDVALGCLVKFHLKPEDRLMFVFVGVFKCI